MKLRILTTEECSNYTAQFFISDITPAEQEKIDKICEANLLINVGGDVKDSNTQAVLYAQGDKYLRFPSQFNEFKKTFVSGLLGTNAETIAKEYVAMIEQRVIDIDTQIESFVDDFSDDREILL